MIQFALCSVILTAVLGGPMQKRSGQTDVYEITYVTSQGNSTWTLVNWKLRSNTDVIVQAINAYGHSQSHTHSKDVSTELSGEGYMGYAINHNGGSAKNSHTWIITKCALPNLEIALLERTASQKVKDGHLANLKSTMSMCPKNTK